MTTRPPFWSVNVKFDFNGLLSDVSRKNITNVRKSTKTFDGYITIHCVSKKFTLLFL